MKPYYEHAGVTIYHGDSREILPTLAPATIITDPVWPNASKLLRGSEDPWKLWGDTMRLLPRSVTCLTVHLGVLSDPRFLRAPRRLKFFRTCWLPMLPVCFASRAVIGADVAYIFGTPPGKGLIGGETKICAERSPWPVGGGRNRSAAEYHERQMARPHPSPRKLQHLRWLVARFAADLLCDPFAGTGTTLLAAKAQNVPAVGIEIEERYCELAAGRLSQEILPLGAEA